MYNYIHLYTHVYARLQHNNDTKMQHAILIFDEYGVLCLGDNNNNEHQSNSTSGSSNPDQDEQQLSPPVLVAPDDLRAVLTSLLPPEMSVLPALRRCAELGWVVAHDARDPRSRRRRVLLVRY